MTSSTRFIALIQRNFGRAVRLVAGLTLYGVAIALIVTARLGVDPWSVLTQGLAARTGLSFGVIADLIGAALLIVWWPLRQRPGIGTIANVLVVGIVAQLILDLTSTPASPVWRAALLLAGIGLLSVATGLYVSARLGAGPRDGLMFGLHDRFGLPLWLARLLVEAAVLITGWLLGGDAGIGTLLFAVLIGPLCGITVPRLAMRTPVQPLESQALHSPLQ